LGDVEHPHMIDFVATVKDHDSECVDSRYSRQSRGGSGTRQRDPSDHRAGDLESSLECRTMNPPVVWMSSSNFRVFGN
jgi:hypothetical protein